MPGSFDFAMADTAVSLRANLTRLSSEDDFRWIAPVVAQTSEQFISEKLPTDLNKHRYASWMIDENLQEAAKALNNALNNRADAMSLEAQGMQAALELELAMQVGDIEERLAQVSLLAAYRQAGQEQPQDSVVSERSELLRKAQRAQLALHNMPGGALNYGERIQFLRRLYLDNVVTAYERLYAIWLGSAVHLGIALDIPPNWSNKYDILFDLVHWLRLANRRIQEGIVSERRFQIMLFLSDLARDGDIDGIDVEGFRKSLLSDMSREYKFTLSSRHFDGVTENDTIRILGVGVGYGWGDLPPFSEAYNGTSETRSQSSFLIDRIQTTRRSQIANWIVGFPKQKTDLPGLIDAERKWSVPDLHLIGGGWTEGNPANEMGMVQETQFININALGSWSLESVYTRNALEYGEGFTMETADKYLRPSDVIVTLRVAVRGS